MKSVSATSGPSPSCSVPRCSSTPWSCWCPIVWSLGLHLLRRQRRSAASTSSGWTNFVTLFNDPTVARRGLVHRQVRRLITVGQVVVGLPARAAVRVRARALVRPHPHPRLLPGRAADRRGRAAVPEAVRSRHRRPAWSTRSSTTVGARRRRLARQPATPRSRHRRSWTSGGPWASTPCCSTPGLVDIPEDILESARLDGATGWQLIRHIVLPLSLPVLLSLGHLQHQRHAQGLRLDRRADQRRARATRRHR